MIHLFGYIKKHNYLLKKIESVKINVADIHFGLESNSRRALDETCWFLGNTQFVNYIIYVFNLYYYFLNISLKKKNLTFSKYLIEYNVFEI